MAGSTNEHGHLVNHLANDEDKIKATLAPLGLVVCNFKALDH